MIDENLLLFMIPILANSKTKIKNRLEEKK